MGSLAEGVICRLLLMSSMIYNAINYVTIEFQTPQNVAPNGMLFCLNDTAFQIARSFSVVTLKEGGSIFKQDEATVISESDEWTLSPFFLPTLSKAGQLGAAEFGTLDQFLATDPYFASSYTNLR